MRIVVPELAHTPSYEPQLNADRQPVGFSGLSGFSTPPLNGNHRRLLAGNPRCPSVGTHAPYGLREDTVSQVASPASIDTTVLVEAVQKGQVCEQSSTTCIRKALVPFVIDLMVGPLNQCLRNHRR